MLYVDTFGAFGGVGRCTIELLPFLAPRMGKVVLAGQSHIVNSFGNSLPASAILELRNLERPAYLPSALILRALASMCPDSPKFTDALLGRAGVLTHNKEPVLINYPQALPPPRLDYEFDILLHDLNWRRYPENSAEPEELDRRCQEWVRRAGRIFTNSDFTRHEVIELYGTEPSRVLAAPLAAPSLPPAEDLNDDPQKLRAFGVKLDGYFFYPSVNGVHKGHDVLADALEMAGPGALPVVITAPIPAEEHNPSTPGGKYLETVARRLAALRRAGRLISLPHLRWDQVLMLAGSCRAYVLPSRFEGFGFPLVEAMALGKFSICSEIPAFREILDRYGSKIRAATFPCGNGKALAELLAARSDSDGPLSGYKSGRPDLTSSWGWADTAKVIAEAMTS